MKVERYSEEEHSNSSDEGEDGGHEAADSAGVDSNESGVTVKLSANTVGEGVVVDNLDVARIALSVLEHQVHVDLVALSEGVLLSADNFLVEASAIGVALLNEGLDRIEGSGELHGVVASLLDGRHVDGGSAGAVSTKRNNIDATFARVDEFALGLPSGGGSGGKTSTNGVVALIRAERTSWIFLAFVLSVSASLLANTPLVGSRPALVVVSGLCASSVVGIISSLSPASSDPLESSAGRQAVSGVDETRNDKSGGNSTDTSVDSFSCRRHRLLVIADPSVLLVATVSSINIVLVAIGVLRSKHASAGIRLRVVAAEVSKVNGPSSFAACRSVPLAGGQGVPGLQLESKIFVLTVSNDGVPVLSAGALVTPANVATESIEVLSVVDDILRHELILLQKPCLGALNSVGGAVSDGREVGSNNMGDSVAGNTAASSVGELRLSNIGLGLDSEAVGLVIIEQVANIVGNDSVEVVSHASINGSVNVAVSNQVGSEERVASISSVGKGLSVITGVSDCIITFIPPDVVSNNSATAKLFGLFETNRDLILVGNEPWLKDGGRVGNTSRDDLVFDLEPFATALVVASTDLKVVARTSNGHGIGVSGVLDSARVGSAISSGIGVSISGSFTSGSHSQLVAVHIVAVVLDGVGPGQLETVLGRLSDNRQVGAGIWNISIERESTPWRVNNSSTDVSMA